MLVGFIGAALARAVASSLGLKRFYAYGMVTLAVFGFGHLFRISLPYLVISLGVLLMCVGLVVLQRFVTRYPLPGASPDEAE